MTGTARRSVKRAEPDDEKLNVDATQGGCVMLSGEDFDAVLLNMSKKYTDEFAFCNIRENSLNSKLFALKPNHLCREVIIYIIYLIYLYIYI